MCCSRCFVLFLQLDIWWVCGALLGLTHHFVIASRRLFRVHQCVCVRGDSVSLLFGVRFIIMSSCEVVSVFCLRVCLVCVSALTWLRVLLFLRVACVWVSFSYSQHQMKKHETNPPKKNTERQHHETNQGKMKTTITTKNHGKKNHETGNQETRNHEKNHERKITKRPKHGKTKSRKQIT